MNTELLLRRTRRRRRGFLRRFRGRLPGALRRGGRGRLRFRQMFGFLAFLRQRDGRGEINRLPGRFEIRPFEFVDDRLGDLVLGVLAVEQKALDKFHLAFALDRRFRFGFVLRFHVVCFRRCG